jgi:type II secretory pathway pseudopilin PulG
MPAAFRNVPRRRQQNGIALLIMLVLLVMGTLSFFLSRSNAAQLRAERDRKTAAALAQAKEALIGYALSYRDTHAGEVFGYFPCPDTDGDGSAETALGASGATCGATAQDAVVGLLPYRTLGLPDLRDGNGECLWYAVSADYKASMSKATPLNWDTQGQFSIQDANGVTMAAPDDPNGGAAIVIFAVGEPLSNQSRVFDPTLPCGRPNPGTTYPNYIDGGYAFPSTAMPIVIRAGTPDSPTNNDQVAWITPKELWDRIARRPDFNGPTPAGLNEMLAEVALSLKDLYDQDKLPKPTQQPPGTGVTTRTTPTITNGSNGAYYGFLDPSSVSISSAYDAYGHNWLEQARYVLCQGGNQCLNCSGHNAVAALVFAGRNASLNPRNSSQTFSLDETNRTIDPARFNTSLASFLEGNNVTNYASLGANFSGATTYDQAVPSADVVLCIGTGGG